MRRSRLEAFGYALNNIDLSSEHRAVYGQIEMVEKSKRKAKMTRSMRHWRPHIDDENVADAYTENLDIQLEGNDLENFGDIERII